ncbi:MAG: cation transporter [Candidatus Sericytochromatia bacterium]
MDHCCSKKASELEKMKQEKQSKVLWIVLIINLIMFFIEMYYGIISKSTSLMSDSLDMLGDSFVYGFSIFVITRSIKWKTIASLSKSFIMFTFGILVISKIVYQIINPEIPIHQTMTIVGVLALIANIICFLMLYKFRSHDTNMTSTWLCSRNDIITNIGILIVAWIVSITNSIWPDIIFSIIVTCLFLSSSLHILKLSLKDLKQERIVTAK